MVQSGRVFLGRTSVILCLAALTASGQGPEFEVVDVRPAQPLPQGIAQVMLDDGPAVIEVNPHGISHVIARPFTAGGMVNLRFYTMRSLITSAYTEVLQEDYLIGGPNWLDSDHFDLLARAAPDATRETMRLMLQSALADRFHLTVHREQRSMPVLALVAGKNGAKLKPAAPGDGACQGVPGEKGQHRACHNMTMAELVKQLPEIAPGTIDRPVFNLTGLDGAYDFQLDWTPQPRGDTSGETIFDAFEKIGLRIEERKQPMTVIVIDHVDRTPTEN